MNSPSPISSAAHHSPGDRFGSGGLAAVLTLGLVLAATQVAAQDQPRGPKVRQSQSASAVGPSNMTRVAAPGGGVNEPLDFGAVPLGFFATINHAQCFGTVGTCDSVFSVSSIASTPPFTWTNIHVVAAAAIDVTLCSAAGTPYTFGDPIGPNQQLCVDFHFTPPALGPFNGNLRQNDSLGGRNYICTGTGVCPAITLAPPTLPGGALGVPYNQTITASGGTAPYTFTTNGPLPPGLTLSPGGLISGTPTTPGTYIFDVTASDSTSGGPCLGVKTYTIVVGCPLIILAPSSLPNGTPGVPYNQTITASGGTAPYTFSYTGTLPPGLTLSTGGVLSGTPTTAGSFNFTVTATDSTGGGSSRAGTGPTGTSGCTGSQTYTIVIGCPTITLSPAALPDGAVGEPYSKGIVATGGDPPYFFSFTGDLPPGLTFSSGGVISGTPTTLGTFSFSVTVTDSSDCSKTRAYTIVIACPVILLTPATVPGGSVGAPYGPVVISASGGEPPYAITLSSGSLPPGLTLLPNDAASVVLAGTPTTSGNYSFTLSVSDGADCTASQTYAISICDPPGAPQNPTIVPTGNPDGPVTGVDFLDLSWSPPTEGEPATSYDWQINGNPLVNTTATFVHGVTPQALVVPGYNNDPIQLHVYARACGIPGVQGPRADSPIYTPAPPIADFDATVEGLTVTVTDRSSPQATSWLWLFGDGEFSTEQSPGPHTYAASNLYTIVLIASNGAGSNQAATPVQLASVAPVAQRNVVQAFDASRPTQLRLEAVPLTGRGAKWLYVGAAEQDEEKVAYLRFLDEDGNPVVERRLALAPGQTQAVYNLEAFRLNGSYTVELVSSHSLSAYLVAPALPLADPRPGPRRVDR